MTDVDEKPDWELKAIHEWLSRIITRANNLPSPSKRDMEDARCAWRARAALFNGRRPDAITEHWLNRLADRGRPTEKRYARRLLREIQNADPMLRAGD